jgi:hypothetical protein
MAQRPAPVLSLNPTITLIFCESHRRRADGMQPFNWIRILLTREDRLPIIVSYGSKFHRRIIASKIPSRKLHQPEPDGTCLYCGSDRLNSPCKPGLGDFLAGLLKLVPVRWGLKSGNCGCEDCDRRRKALNRLGWRLWLMWRLTQAVLGVLLVGWVTRLRAFFRRIRLIIRGA